MKGGNGMKRVVLGMAAALAIGARAADGGSFEQEKTLKDVGAVLRSEGFWEYEKGEYFRWRTEKPVTSEFFVTATNETFREIERIIEGGGSEGSLGRIGRMERIGEDGARVEFGNGDELKIRLKRDAAMVAQARYVREFNAKDDELYTNVIDNAGAEAFLRENAPRFECPDKTIERTFAFRWWTFRKHLKRTANGWAISEFLPKVAWSGANNTIVCPAGHHILEGRWLKDKGIVEDYLRFWFSAEGAKRRRSYGSWLAYAALEAAKVKGDVSGVAALLDPMAAAWREWENAPVKAKDWPRDGFIMMGGDGKGMFMSTDNREGSEYSLSGSGYRPLFNSAMYGDAVAIAEIAKSAGRKDLEREFSAVAAALRAKILERLWSDERGFFVTLTPDGRRTEVREMHGYAPWYFGVTEGADGVRDAAWQWLLREDGFWAKYGFSFPERRAKGFVLDYHGHECQWNGPAWPYATSIALSALERRLHAGGGVDGLGEDAFGRLVHHYAAMHVRTKENGEEVPWIDEDMNPDTGDWISRTVIINTPAMRKRFPAERGKDYNHSTFCDIVITGLCGVMPKSGGGFEVKPLAPKEWKWWRLSNLVIGGRRVEIVWDETGEHFGDKKGLEIK